MHSSQSLQAKLLSPLENTTILIADNNQFMRKTMRLMLTIIGVKSIHEVADGLAAIEAIRTVEPDVMILDWSIPTPSAPEIMRIIRSPGVFPKPDLPVVIITDNGTHAVVKEAVRLGAHEILARPVSPKVVQQHLLSILFAERKMVQDGENYIPEPRTQIAWELNQI